MNIVARQMMVGFRQYVWYVGSAAVIVLLAAALTLLASPAVDPGAKAHAASYKGTYAYTVGDIDAWGGPTPLAPKDSGYILSVAITKKKGKKVTLQMQQFYFYGTTGSYFSTSKKNTVRLGKNDTATFKFDTFSGDSGKASIKVLSKKKLKVKITTTDYGHERMPLSTGGKYKTLRKQSDGITIVG